MNLVESTNPKVVAVSHQGKWINYRESRDCDDSTTWIFTDGSSNGGFGAVAVRDGEHIKKARGFETPGKTRNIAAELNGLLLALGLARQDESITVVSDYLGVAAWMTNNWRIKEPDVRVKINEAKKIVAAKNLKVDYCHHGGHQRDNSDFTKFNNIADELAGELTS